MILADAIAKHKQAKLLTGTDEHGLKVFNSAKGTNLNQYCNNASDHFRQLADDHIKYATFIRTTNQSHIEKVQDLWRLMVKNGLIEKDIYRGYYCQQEEAFVNHETDLFLEEENYFYKLNQEHIQQFINLAPIRYQNELKQLTMEKICVSRPKDRYKWGIEVPDNDNQLIYVWLDALLGYLQQEEVHYTHVIGKDIVRFHAIYWPSFLRGINNNSTIELVVHDHWIKDKVYIIRQQMKMSKSLGNVVSPQKLSKYFTKEQIRLYFLSQGPQNSDQEINGQNIIKCWNDYIDQFHNTLFRVFRPNLIKPNYLVLKDLDDHLNEIKNEFGITNSRAKKFLDSNKFVEAYQELQKMFALINGVLQKRAPWNNPQEKEKILAFICVLISITQQTLQVFIITPQLVVPNFTEFPSEAVEITVNTSVDLKIAKIKAHELNTSLY